MITENLLDNFIMIELQQCKHIYTVLMGLSYFAKTKFPSEIFHQDWWRLPLSFLESNLALNVKTVPGYFWNIRHTISNEEYFKL